MLWLWPLTTFQLLWILRINRRALEKCLAIGYISVMKHLFFLPLIAVSLFAVPATAQDSTIPLSPMERGAQLFLEGLLKEMAPAIREFEGLADEMAPALRRFTESMGPAMTNLLETVEDWSVYAPPEVLPNGDIIMRRKPQIPKKPITPMAPAPQIDL